MALASRPSDSASLLDVDPSLARLLGMRAAATVGRRPLLPVLTVSRGGWAPPERSRSGPELIGFAVLDGMLLHEDDRRPAAAFGPGDLVEPWPDSDDAAGGRWSACMPARLALIGRSFLDALRPWPGARERLLARAARQQERASAVAAAATQPEPRERVLAVLWCLAARWGRCIPGGMALDMALDDDALARLTLLAPVDLRAALGLLERDGTLRRSRRGGLLLAAPAAPHAGVDTSDRQRELLRAKVAEQLATSRSVERDHLAICAQLDELLRQRTSLSSVGRARRSESHRPIAAPLRVDSDP